MSLVRHMSCVTSLRLRWATDPPDSAAVVSERIMRPYTAAFPGRFHNKKRIGPFEETRRHRPAKLQAKDKTPNCRCGTAQLGVLLFSAGTAVYCHCSVRRSAAGARVVHPSFLSEEPLWLALPSCSTNNKRPLRATAVYRARFREPWASGRQRPGPPAAHIPVQQPTACSQKQSLLSYYQTLHFLLEFIVLLAGHPWSSAKGAKLARGP